MPQLQSHPPAPARPATDCFRLAMASSRIGMAIVDLEQRWLEVNPALARLLDCAPEDMVGRSTREYLPSEDSESNAEDWKQLLSGDVEFIDAPRRFTRKGGELLWTQANVAVMRGDDGSPLYLVVQLRDIGAERKAHEALLASQKQLGEALAAAHRQHQVFADAVSHDLRAPVRSIESFSGLLADSLGEGIDKSSRGYLERIRAAAGRMSTLLVSMSELSSVSRTELRLVEVDISMLADWSLAELQDAEPGRAAEVIVQPDLIAHGDERQLKVLLTKLLENAWRFSAEQPKVVIRVTGQCGEDGLDLTIEDEGSGFDMRYLSKLFEPFQRLHGPDHGGGSGLGLAIAQRIVERHGGTLRAESGPGQGSRFHLHLPPPPA